MTRKLSVGESFVSGSSMEIGASGSGPDHGSMHSTHSCFVSSGRYAGAGVGVGVLVGVEVGVGV
jgi:hypothetical protein